VDLVYNYVLDAGHVMLIDGVECATLGHGITGNSVISHSFFGTQAVVQNLQTMSGWNAGRITFGAGCLVRDDRTAHVVGYDKSREVIKVADV